MSEVAVHSAFEIATTASQSGKTIAQQINAMRRERDWRMQRAAQIIAAGGPPIKVTEAKQEWTRLMLEKQAADEAAAAAAQHRAFRESWCNMVRLAMYQRSPISRQRILQEVSIKHGVSVIDIKSKRRSQDVVPARFEACYRLKNETTMSLPAIGRYLGGRDHTTILHAIRKHAARVKAGMEHPPSDKRVDWSKIVDGVAR